MQEIGRVGLFYATLYYNNHDIAGKNYVDDPMKEYCKESSCLKSALTSSFGFDASLQENCCCFVYTPGY